MARMLLCMGCGETVEQLRPEFEARVTAISVKHGPGREAAVAEALDEMFVDMRCSRDALANGMDSELPQIQKMFAQHMAAQNRLIKQGARIAPAELAKPEPADGLPYECVRCLRRTALATGRPLVVCPDCGAGSDTFAKCPGDEVRWM